MPGREKQNAGNQIDASVSRSSNVRLLRKLFEIGIHHPDLLQLITYPFDFCCIGRRHWSCRGWAYSHRRFTLKNEYCCVRLRHIWPGHYPSDRITVVDDRELIRNMVSGRVASITGRFLLTFPLACCQRGKEEARNHAGRVERYSH